MTQTQAVPSSSTPLTLEDYIREVQRLDSEFSEGVVTEIRIHPDDLQDLLKELQKGQAGIKHSDSKTPVTGRAGRGIFGVKVIEDFDAPRLPRKQITEKELK